MKYLMLVCAMVVSMASASGFAASKVLIVLTNHSQLGDTGERTGFWLSELTHPYYVLKDQGFQVDLASIEGGPAPIDPRSLEDKDPQQARFLSDAQLMAKVLTTPPLKAINPEQYAAILFSGGHGSMWDFANNAQVNRMASAIYENNGVVAALCHGPAALVGVKLSDGEFLIAGKKVTGFTNSEEAKVGLTEKVPFLLEDRLVSLGGRFQASADFSDNVVVDNRVVTGQNPQSAESVGKALVELLKK